MRLTQIIKSAQEFMLSANIAGWLLYEYHNMNPIFWNLIGNLPNITRPCWLWIPVSGEPTLLVNYVDKGRFANIETAVSVFVGRTNMISSLAKLINSEGSIAMEYSPLGAIPRMSLVDSGTLELVRSLGPKIVSSADLVQYSCQRWDKDQLNSHIFAAHTLTSIVNDAFRYIGEKLDSGISEYNVAEFIRKSYKEKGMQASDGPVVAINYHSSDPHFEPTPKNSKNIRENDWVLIDLWASLQDEDSMYADITWVAYVGDSVPDQYQSVFQIVKHAREAALEELKTAFTQQRQLQGWELDKVARDIIVNAGFGGYFNHRLGHSIGHEVHGDSVNLDDLETHDTRHIVPGLAVSIEPGIYLPEFGVRSEIDVYISEDGPLLTTEAQQEIVLISSFHKD